MFTVYIYPPPQKKNRLLILRSDKQILNQESKVNLCLRPLPTCYIGAPCLNKALFCAFFYFLFLHPTRKRQIKSPERLILLNNTFEQRGEIQNLPGLRSRKFFLPTYWKFNTSWLFEFSVRASGTVHMLITLFDRRQIFCVSRVV